ncbi:hypothetical protein LZ554_004586 [Drepanopeziza brunnea f. sp. 'monogermtubi']|nr:hypothetical protein LZ554_004586 [Drepanopeziza brunnea f. sp. 'monogermtubi']
MPKYEQTSDVSGPFAAGEPKLLFAARNDDRPGGNDEEPIRSMKPASSDSVEALSEEPHLNTYMRGGMFQPVLCKKAIRSVELRVFNSQSPQSHNVVTVSSLEPSELINLEEFQPRMPSHIDIGSTSAQIYQSRSHAPSDQCQSDQTRARFYKMR